MLVPEDRNEMEIISIAMSTAMTKSIICLLNFYKAVLKASNPTYRSYLAAQAKEWSNNIVSTSTILWWDREYRQCQKGGGG